MAQCKICKEWNGKHLSICPNFTGEIDVPEIPLDPVDPVDPEKEYCSQCGELLPNHKTTCPLYGSGSGVITGDEVICKNCGKPTSVSIFNDFKCENCGKSAVEVEDEPGKTVEEIEWEDPTTIEPIRGVGDKICTNKELYEFAASSSRPSNENRCPSKGKWNNKNLGRWKLSIDDHIKDNQLFALKNVVKELRPINLVMNFDITSSRDDDDLIFNFEVVNTSTNSDLLTNYTKNGTFAIYGYYFDTTAKSWRKFACTYQYSNETSDQFRFKETEITKSKQKRDEILPPVAGAPVTGEYHNIDSWIKAAGAPATGEYHNIDSWIKEIRLDGRIVYNSNYPIGYYPISLYDPTTDNLINLTFNISGNTDTSRPASRPIIMEINAGDSLTPKAGVYLNKSDVKVKNPASYSCTAYIQYNGSIGKRMDGSSSTDGHIIITGTFNSTYKLVYDPKGINDSTLSVEQLTFDVKMKDGEGYYPNINDIVILSSDVSTGSRSNVNIDKFESSQLSRFDSMKLYYPVWSESGAKYNMVSVSYY